FYTFVTQASLLVNTQSSPTPTVTSTESSDAESTASSSPSSTLGAGAVPTTVAFPSNLPSRIVPADATLTQPEGTTLISILFNEKLSWEWLASQADATSQVFAFAPQLIATALSIDPSRVQTYALQAYQPAVFAGDNTGTLLSLYLCFIPS